MVGQVLQEKKKKKKNTPHGSTTISSSLLSSERVLRRVRRRGKLSDYSRSDKEVQTLAGRDGVKDPPIFERFNRRNNHPVYASHSTGFRTRGCYMHFLAFLTRSEDFSYPHTSLASCLLYHSRRVEGYLIPFAQGINICCM